MNRVIAAFIGICLLLPVPAFARDESQGWFWWQKKPRPVAQAGSAATEAQPPADQQTTAQEHLERMHQQRMEKLRARLNKNSGLSDADKTELISIYERHYAARLAHQVRNRQESRAILENVQSDPQMTREERTTAIRDYIQRSRQESIERRKEERAEINRFWQDIRDRKPRPEGVSPAVRIRRAPRK